MFVQYHTEKDNEKNLEDSKIKLNKINELQIQVARVLSYSLHNLSKNCEGLYSEATNEASAVNQDHLSIIEEFEMKTSYIDKQLHHNEMLLGD